MTIVTKLLRRSFYPVISITVPLLLYALVLIFRVPTEISFAAKNGLTPVLIAIALLFYPAYRLSGWIGTLLSLSLTLILFALPLSALWNSGISGPFIIGGLLPTGDAGGYYWEARRLLEVGQISAWGSRRPLFPSFLATLLGLTQQNLLLTLAILVALTTISCFLAAREVQRSHGTAAGLMVIAILFLFYRRFIGHTMTEDLGLALGAVSFTILWRGARQKQINYCLAGILLLTIALNARAGAFFILPALVLWGTWSFRGALRFSWRFLLGGSSLVLLGFILNSILLKIIGSADAIAFSNFSYTLYGLIVGGDWGQVIQDHPEVANMSDSQAAQKIYALAFEALRTHPLGLLNGSLRAWDEFLFKDYIFSFIPDLKTNFCLQILSLIALLNCYRQRREPNASLIAVATLGILVSVPFVPPWDADAMRAYGATIPFLATLPALGLAFIVKNLEWHQLVKVPGQDDSSQDLLVLSLICAGFVFLGPITTKVLSRAPQLDHLSCPEGTKAIHLRISSGSSIHLIDDNSRQKTHMPIVRLSDFRNGLLKTPHNIDPDVVKELTSLNASTYLISMLNLNDNKPSWLIIESLMMPKKTGRFAACGTPATHPGAYLQGFFYAKSIKPVSTINN